MIGVLGYSAERHLQVIQEESYEDGVKVGYGNGYKKGYDEGEEALTELYDWLFENNRVADVQKANKDAEYRKSCQMSMLKYQSQQRIIEKKPVSI